MPFGFAAAPPGMYYDPASGVLLPNGVFLASAGRRVGGWFLSIGLCLITLVVGYIVWSLIVWGQGLTPSKQVLGMRCYRPQEGRVASWGYMALRQVVGGIVEGLFSGIVLIVSAIMMLTSKDHRAIHDHMAGTVVVYDPNRVLAPR